LLNQPVRGGSFRQPFRSGNQGRDSGPHGLPSSDSFPQIGSAEGRRCPLLVQEDQSTQQRDRLTAFPVPGSKSRGLAARHRSVARTIFSASAAVKHKPSFFPIFVTRAGGRFRQVWCRSGQVWADSLGRPWPPEYPLAVIFHPELQHLLAL